LTGSENMLYTLLSWLVQVLQMSHCSIPELVEELQWSDFKQVPQMLQQARHTHALCDL